MVGAQHKQTAKRGRPRDGEGGSWGGNGLINMKERRKEHRRRRKEKKREFRHRRKLLMVEDGESLDCRVLLTRLEEKTVTGRGKDEPRRVKPPRKEIKTKQRSGSVHTGTKLDKSGQRRVSASRRQEPKTDQSDALLTLSAPTPEPRKRRMASLNAEAVNSLLLYKDDMPASKVCKKQNLTNNLAKETETAIVDFDESVGCDDKKVFSKDKNKLNERPKKVMMKKKTKKKREAESIDWLALLTPTPRRQAGLTAATLLKLTSCPSGIKRQKKTECKTNVEPESKETAQQETSCSKPVAEEPVQTKRPTHPKHKQRLKHGKQGMQELTHSQSGSHVQRRYTSCKTERTVTEEQEQGAAEGHERHKPGLPCRTMLGFSLKPVKEEQVEVPPCYRCSQERCVEYCHRLALFLGEKSFQEPEEGSQRSKVYHHHHHHHHHHLQPPHSMSHPAAIPINPHAYRCFPGYYLHFSHRDTSPSSIPPAGLCTKGGKRPKLLPKPDPQPSGIPHPVFCCASMETCYGEPCRISGFSAYTSVIPAIASRGCSYSNVGCNLCSQCIKTDYSSHLKDHHSPSSIPSPPNPRTLTGCPVPTVPPAGQSVPHVQTPLSDPSQPQPPLQVARECPQSAKAPSGSRSGAHGTDGVSAAVCPLNRDKKQKLLSASDRDRAVKQLKNGRKKATNGWQPIGLPFQKEVFTVGEEALVQKNCFEGVQRDGEVIRVRDTVLLKSGPRKKSLPYVAKISAFWEDPESGEMMMSLFWYYRPEHTQGGRIADMHCENEIFASRHQDVNSVACIEDKCYVLTLAQYCRFCALVKRCGEGVPDSATSVVVPPAAGHATPSHRSVPDDVDPDLVFVCRHVYDFRYGRLLKNLQ